MMNPGADVGFDMHFGIPALSGIHAGFGTTGLVVDDLFRDDPESTINERIEDALYRLSENDYTAVSQRLELLSAGWCNRSGDYFSAGWYQETDLIVYLPRDPAIFAFEGNASNLGQPLDFSDISARGEVVSVFHFGMNRKINRKLHVGARIKLYSSMYNGTSTNNTGTFTTTRTPDGNNIYRHSLRGLDASLKTSGVLDYELLQARDVVSSAFFSGNHGLGVDVGFSYKLDRQWRLTASLVDLGMIFHKEETREYAASGNYDFDGIGLQYPTLENLDEDPAYYEDLIDDFEENVPYSNTTGISYTTFRPVKFYSSIEYRFGEPKVLNCIDPDDNEYRFRTGLTVFAINRPRLPQASVTGYFDAKLLDFLHTKLTYTVDPFTATNLGFLVSAQIAKFNVYLAADNMLGYENLAQSKALNVQMGLQFIINSDN